VFFCSTGRGPDRILYTIRLRKRPGHKPRQRKWFMLFTADTRAYPGLGIFPTLTEAKAAAEVHCAKQKELAT
jgi:hypothetical protein